MILEDGFVLKLVVTKLSSYEAQRNFRMRMARKENGSHAENQKQSTCRRQQHHSDAEMDPNPIPLALISLAPPPLDIVSSLDADNKRFTLSEQSNPAGTDLAGTASA